MPTIKMHATFISEPDNDIQPITSTIDITDNDVQTFRNISDNIDIPARVIEAIKLLMLHAMHS